MSYYAGSCDVAVIGAGHAGIEAALAAASAGLHEVTGKLKAVENTLREKKDLQKQLLAYIKTKPARDGGRRKRRKPGEPTGSSTKASLSFPNLPPGISRHRESPSCQRPRHYKQRLSSLQGRRTRFTTNTGRRKRASGNCRL